jgi:thioredoxin-like negative regulator of GroEL
MTPVVDGLQQRYESSITFIRVDAGATDARSVLEALRVRGHPAVIIFDDDRQESARFNGVVDEDRLAKALDAVAPR